MNFTPRFDQPSESNDMERIEEASEQWIDSIELPGETDTWQDAIALPESMELSYESSENLGVNESRYDEATQVKYLSGYLNGCKELEPENWKNLSLEERVKVLQTIESVAAFLGGRPTLKVQSEPMAKNVYGEMNWDNQKISLNENLVKSDNPECLRQVLKTLAHEGRHAYQYSNLFNARTEPNTEKYQSWKVNYQTGYRQASFFGMYDYYLQPLEVDARVFSESVVSKLSI